MNRIHYLWISCLVLFLLTVPFLFKTGDPTIEELSAILKTYFDSKQVEKKELLFIKKYYELDSTQLEDAQVYASISAMGVEEFAIFRIKDHDVLKNVKKKVEQRLEKQKRAFEGYAPKQFAILEKGEIIVKGNYVLLIISPEVTQIKRVVQKAF